MAKLSSAGFLTVNVRSRPPGELDVTDHSFSLHQFTFSLL